MAAIARDPQPHDGRPATDLIVKFLEHFALISEALEDAGALGRRGRLLLRPARAGPTARSCRSRCARWSASCRCSAFAVGRRARPSSARGRWASASRACSSGTTSRIARCRASWSRETRPRRSLGVVGVERVLRVFDAALRRGGVPLAVRAAGRLALAPRASVHARRRRARSRRSTTSRPSRRPACSAATRTGAGRSGSRSTTSSSTRSLRYARFFGDELTIEYPTGSGEQRTLGEIGEDLRRPADLALPRRRGRTPARASAGSTRSRPTRPGRTTSSSTSTSTATTAPGSAPSHQTGLDGHRRRPDPPQPRRATCRRSASC